jgi:TP901 family phage tail tape measure protein
MRKDFNDTFKISLGALVADGIKSAGAALVDFGKESVAVFLELEGSLNQVSKTTGLEGEELLKLETALRETAAAIGPVTTKDLADVVAIAGQLGIASDKIDAQKFGEAREELQNFALVIAKSKEAMKEFSGGAEEIATVISKQLALYRQGPDAAEEFLAVMNGLGDAMATDAKQISSFLASFTMAPSLNMMQHEAAAMGAVFISLGQDANDAATRYQSALANILSGSKKTNEAVKSLIEGNKKAQEDLAGIVDLSAHTIKVKGQETVNWVGVVREAVGKDAIGATKILTESISALDTQSKQLTASVEIFGRVGSRIWNVLLGQNAEITEAGKEAATALLSTEESLKKLEEDLGTTREAFGTTGEFIAKALTEKPEVAVGVLLEGIAGIEDSAKQTQTAIAIFGEDIGKRVADGGQSGLEMLDKALQKSKALAEEVQQGTGSSIEREYQRSLQRLGASFEVFQSQLTATQEIIGKDIATALSGVVSTDFMPLVEDFREWYQTSEEAAHFFKETLPGAIKLTAGALVGIGKALGGAIQAITDAAEWWGQTIDSITAKIQKMEEGYAKADEAFELGQKSMKDTYNALQDLNEQFVFTQRGTDEMYNAFVKLEEGLEKSLKAGIEPSQELKDGVVALEEAVRRYKSGAEGAKTANEALSKSLYLQGDAVLAVDDAYEGRSLTPALKRYVEAALSGEQTTESLTQSQKDAFLQVMETDKAYQTIKDTFIEHQNSVRSFDNAIREQKTLLESIDAADKERRKEINATIDSLQAKKREEQNIINVLRIEQTELKASIETQSDAIRSQKEQADSVETLEEKYTKFFSGLSQDTQNWLFVQDSLKGALESFGVTVDDVMLKVAEKTKLESIEKQEIKDISEAIEWRAMSEQRYYEDLEQKSKSFFGGLSQATQKWLIQSGEMTTMLRSVGIQTDALSMSIYNQIAAEERQSMAVNESSQALDAKYIYVQKLFDGLSEKTQQWLVDSNNIETSLRGIGVFTDSVSLSIFNQIAAEERQKQALEKTNEALDKQFAKLIQHGQATDALTQKTNMYAMSLEGLTTGIGGALSTEAGEIVVGQTVYQGSLGGFGGMSVEKVSTEDLLGPIRKLSEDAQQNLFRMSNADILSALGKDYNVTEGAFQVLDQYRKQLESRRALSDLESSLTQQQSSFQSAQSRPSQSSGSMPAPTMGGGYTFNLYATYADQNAFQKFARDVKTEIDRQQSFMVR